MWMLRLRGVVRPFVKLTPPASKLACTGTCRTLCAASKPSYTDRMDKTGRPVSPHLMIYRLPLIAISSVTVRLTGIIVSAAVIAIAGATLLGGSSVVSDTVQDVAGSHPPFVPAAKFALAWPLTYHWLGNIRHIVWDMTVKGFNNQTMLHTSYGIYITTTVISAAIAIYSLPPIPKDKHK